jgi:hypothetical protein
LQLEQMHGAFHPSDAATQGSARFKAKYPAAIRKEVFRAAHAGDSIVALKRIPRAMSTEKRRGPRAWSKAKGPADEP